MALPISITTITPEMKAELDRLKGDWNNFYYQWWRKFTPIGTNRTVTQEDYDEVMAVAASMARLNYMLAMSTTS